MTDLQDEIALKQKAIKTALNGDWAAAIELNLLLLEQNPADIDALNRLGLAYTITGKANEAKEAYQKVFEIDPLNPIAQKNLKKLKDKTANGNGGANFQINCNFLEETGKTKVVDLINTAQPNIVQMLRTGQSVELSIKRSKIFVLEGGKQYIGVLPDDIGNRLIKFMNCGNQYQAYIKSTNQNRVQVFIKEIKRAAKYKNHPSFITTGEPVLDLEKPKKTSKSEEDED